MFKEIGQRIKRHPKIGAFDWEVEVGMPRQLYDAVFEVVELLLHGFALITTEGDPTRYWARPTDYVPAKANHVVLEEV